MGCRCTAKTHCLEDISKIEKIMDLFSNAQQLNNSVSQSLRDLAYSCVATFESSNILSLVSDEVKLNIDIVDLFPTIISKCQEKIKELNEIYDQLREEDYHYHHKHHHDND